MPMPKDDVNRIIKATMPINHLSSKFIMTSLVKIYFGKLSAAFLQMHGSQLPRSFRTGTGIWPLV
jgi:hypothetical protein